MKNDFKTGSNPKTRLTIWDISRMVGVSQTTVSKALLNKGGVSEETRRRILDVANAHGFKMNRMAQSLPRQLKRIGVVTEQCSSPYLRAVLSGMEYEFDQILDYKIVPMWGALEEVPSEQRVMDEITALIANNIDGVILCPNRFDYRFVAQRLADRNIPLVTVTTDIEQPHLRMCCVADHAEVIGRMAAQQLGVLCGEGEYAIVASYRNVVGQKTAINSFMNYLSSQGMGSHVRIYETKTDNELAYEITGNMLLDMPNLKGIFYSSSPYHSSCQRILEAGLQDRVALVGVDIYDELIPFIESGVLKYTLYKNPYWQGRTSVHIMYEYLAENKKPIDMVLVNPHMVSRTNLNAYKIDNISPY